MLAKYLELLTAFINVNSDLQNRIRDFGKFAVDLFLVLIFRTAFDNLE